MNIDVQELKNQAEYYRNLYQTGKVSRDKAKENINPYIDKVNEKAQELSKKYNQKYKPVNFNGFVR